MKKTTILSCFLPLLGAACADPPPVEMPAPPPDLYVFIDAAKPVVSAVEAVAAPLLISTPEQAQAALGQRARVVGTAQDAKLSAVVESEGLLVYCMARGAEGLLAEVRWPEDTLGRPVAVTGTLVQTDQFMAQVGPDGAVSQGTEDPVLVLVDHELTLVELPAAQPEPEPEPEG